jgi:ribosomal protein L9
MQLILLEKIANLGNLGDKVNVKAGYGRNYLLPFGKATAATAANLAASGVEVQKSEVRLPNGTIRNVGEFDVAVHLHAEVEATVRVVVVAA